MPLALITGASSGLGRGFAIELAKRGYDIIATARRTELLESLGNEINAFGVSFQLVTADLNSPDAAQFLASEVSETPDIFINNAGLGFRGGFAQMEPEKINSMLMVNLVNATSLFHTFSRRMLDKKSGYILNVASVAAYSPLPWFAVYAATKSYLRSLSLAAGEEMRSSGVSVSVLCPGPVRTEFFEKTGVTKLHGTKFLWSQEKQVVSCGLEGLLNGKSEIVTGPVYLAQKLFSAYLPDHLMIKTSGYIFHP